jgi:hypothetical protein
MKVKYFDVVDIGDIENDLHKSIFEKAEPFLRTRHNSIHTIISYRYAIYLLSMEGGDPSIVIPAILLHDVGWSTVPEDKQLQAFGPRVKEPDLARRHEIEGAGIARMILSELNYPENLICKIEQIIDGHDSRTVATDIDDMIVKDSDKLFRVSRTGFSIGLGWFKSEPRKYLAGLCKATESWFFTKSAHRVACEELKTREEDLEKNLYASSQ